MPPVQARLSMDERIEAEAARLAEDLLIEAVAGTILATTPAARVEATVHTVAAAEADVPWAPVPVRIARKFLKDVPEAALDLMFPTVYEEDRTAKIRDLITAHDVQAITHQRMASQVVKELGVDEDYDYKDEQAKLVDEQRTMMPTTPLGMGDTLARGVVGPMGGQPGGGAGAAGGQPVQARLAGAGTQPRRDALSGDATREFRQQQRQSEAEIRRLTDIVEALRGDLRAVRETFDPAQHPREPAGSEQGGEFTAGAGGGGGGAGDAASREAWDPAKHPRAAAGSPAGGEFTAGGGGGTATAEAPTTGGGEAPDPERSSFLHGVVGKLQEPDGGFTVHPLRDAPTTGYMVSVYPERGQAMALDAVTPETLWSFFYKNRDIADQPGTYYGGWHDPATHKVWLDISRHVTTPDEAERLGHEHKQISYFDLAHGKSVSLRRAA